MWDGKMAAEEFQGASPQGKRSFHLTTTKGRHDIPLGEGLKSGFLSTLTPDNIQGGSVEGGAYSIPSCSHPVKRGRGELAEM